MTVPDWFLLAAGAFCAFVGSVVYLIGWYRGWKMGWRDGYDSGYRDGRRDGALYDDAADHLPLRSTRKPGLVKPPKEVPDEGW